MCPKQLLFSKSSSNVITFISFHLHKANISGGYTDQLLTKCPISTNLFEGEVNVRQREIVLRCNPSTMPASNVEQL